MNLLKKINISGEIFFEYAFLTYEFYFTETDESVGAEYIFALPEGAAISDVKIICTDGRRIETSVISASHAARLKDAATTAVLRRLDDNTYSISMGDLGAGIKTLRLKAYAQLASAADERQLIIPLSARLGGEGRSNTTAKISLSLRGTKEFENSYESPTHKLNTTSLDNETQIETDEIPANRDFCLRIGGGIKRNSAIVSKGSFGGELLCTIYPDIELKKFEKTLFILDATGSLLYRADLVARELLCAMAERTEGEFAVVVAGESPTMITDGFCRASAENISALINAASGLRISGGSLSEAFEYAGKVANNNTQIVLISGLSLVEGQLAADTAERIFIKGSLNVITLGATTRGGDIDGMVTACGGKRAHIYGGDDIKLRAESILNSFKRLSFEGAEVSAEYGEAYVIDASGDRITVFAKYSGEAVPKKFFIKQDGKGQIAIAEDVSVYQSFAPIGLACGAMMSESLESRLRDCGADEVLQIKEQLEKVGVKYSVLNSETALAAVINGKRPAAMRVCIPSGACNSYEVFASRNSVFGETDGINITKRQERELLYAYLDIIIKSMRADGAICADGEINQSLRKQQTLVALLTLSALGLLDEYRDFAERAIGYLGDVEFLGLKFTYDRDEAEKMLGRLWGKSETIWTSGIPDLLTACRCLLSVMKAQKIDKFRRGV